MKKRNFKLNLAIYISIIWGIVSLVISTPILIFSLEPLSFARFLGAVLFFIIFNVVFTFPVWLAWLVFGWGELIFTIKKINRLFCHAFSKCVQVSMSLRSRFYYKRLWQGDAPLWYSWWILGVTPTLILHVLLNAINLHENYVTALIIAPFYIFYVFTIVIIVWRSAYKAYINHTSGWGIVANILMVIGVASLIGSVHQYIDNYTPYTAFYVCLNLSLICLLLCIFLKLLQHTIPRVFAKYAHRISM